MTAVEITDYAGFFHFVRAGGWSNEQVAGDVQMPPDLSALQEAVGETQYLEWAMMLLDGEEPPDVPVVVESDSRNRVITPAAEVMDDGLVTGAGQRDSAADSNLPDGINDGPADEEIPTKPDRTEVKGILFDLMWEHGCNFFDSPNSDETLAAGGIQRSDFDDVMIRQVKDEVPKKLKRDIREEVEAVNAQVHFKSHSDSVPDQTPAETAPEASKAILEPSAPIQPKCLTWLDPVEENTDTGRIQVWRTECGLYRIVRAAESVDPRFTALVRIDAVSAKERIVADDMKSLRRAQEAVRLHHQDDEPPDDAVVIQAEKIGLGTINSDNEGDGVRQRFVLNWLNPVLENVGGAKCLVWRAEGTGYLVVTNYPRTISEEKEVNRFGAGFDFRTIDSYYFKLKEALLACEKHCGLARGGKRPVKSNSVEIVEKATAVFLADNTQVPVIGLPEYDTWLENLEQFGLGKRSCIVNVKESDGRALLAAVGYVETEEEKWTPNKVRRMLVRLPNVLNDIKQPEEDGQKKVLKNILKALEKGEEIVLEVLGSDAVRKNGKPRKSKEGEEKPARVKRSSGGEVNAFGSPIGSNNDKVDSVLSKTPMSFAQIMEASGLTHNQVRYSHLKELVDKGHAVKTEGGWALK